MGPVISPMTEPNAIKGILRPAMGVRPGDAAEPFADRVLALGDIGRLIEKREGPLGAGQ